MGCFRLLPLSGKTESRNSSVFFGCQQGVFVIHDVTGTSISSGWSSACSTSQGRVPYAKSILRLQRIHSALHQGGPFWQRPLLCWWQCNGSPAAWAARCKGSAYFCLMYWTTFWVIPVTVANEGVFTGIPNFQHNNPGGDCYWAWGTTQTILAKQNRVQN